MTPDTSMTYRKMAEKNIAMLHVKCTRGIFSDRLFKTVSRGADQFYPLQDLMWMTDFLRCEEQHIAAGCLEALVRHGYRLSDCEDVLRDRVRDRIFSNTAIDLAGEMNKPDTLLIYMDEDLGYLNKVIVTLKKTRNESYLTTLMLSENDALVNAVNRITKGV